MLKSILSYLDEKEWATAAEISIHLGVHLRLLEPMLDQLLRKQYLCCKEASLCPGCDFSCLSCEQPKLYCLHKASLPAS